MSDAPAIDMGGSTGTQLLDELRRALGYHFWLILLVAVGSVLATYTGLQFISEQYVSTGKLLVKLGRENLELPVTVDKGGLMSTGVRREEINSEIQLISSRQLIEATVDTIGLDAFSPQPPEPTTWFGRVKRMVRDAVKEVRATLSEWAIVLNLRPRLTEREKVLLLVQGALTVDREKDSDVIAVTVRLPSAVLASKVVDTLIQLYLDSRLAIRRDHGMSEFFDEQLDSLRSKLKLLDSGKLRLRERSKISTVDEERNLLVGRLQTLHAEIAVDQRELSLLGSGSGVAAGSSRQPRPLAALGDAAVDPSLRLSSYPNLEQLRSKITELRLRKTDLLQKFLPDAEAVQRIDREIVRIDSTMRHAFASLLGERKTLAASIERRLSALNKGEMELEVLDRDRVLINQNYQSYAKRREEARVSEALDLRRVSNIAVLNPATNPIEPVSPRKMLVMALSFPFGLMAGLAIALFLEYMNQTFRDERDLVGAERELFLGLLRSEGG